MGALAFSLDGKRLAASLHDSAVIIDLSSKEFVCTFEQPGSAEFAMFSPDGMVLLSSSDGGAPDSRCGRSVIYQAPKRVL